MPSSKNYVRDYKQERRTQQSSKKQKAENASRKRARYKLEKQGRVKKGDGKDVAHKNNNPLDNRSTNLFVQLKSKNRSYPRNSKGGHKKGKS